MENVTKVYFDPLLSDENYIKALLTSLPVGSAHPHQGHLLVHTSSGIDSVDLSMHNEDYFSNAISLGDLGEDILERMKSFSEISMFNNEFTIQQIPSATFKIPLESGQIHIFAISLLTPTYYDLCLADSNNRTSCYNARSTFKGIKHSGDITQKSMLLHHVKLTSEMDNNPLTIFVSGYSYTKLSKYKAYNPLVLVANHKTKVLYIIPVPLEAATIGDGILCCPVVIKRDENDLLCSVLPTPAIDNNLMCSGASLPSPAFATAIERATFVLEEPQVGDTSGNRITQILNVTTPMAPVEITSDNVIIATHGTVLPDMLQQQSQIIRFGKGIKWITGEQTNKADENSHIVLPCVLGGMLEGPMILATGESPVNIPFTTTSDLRQYYRKAKSVVVFVDEKMSDNARNLATDWRLNGLFIIQRLGTTPTDSEDITTLLEKVKINAVTALAGPQALVLVQLGTAYFYYRGIANPKHMDTSDFKFGQNVTELLANVETDKLMDLNWPRLVNLSEENPIFMPKSNQTLQLEQLKESFRTSSLDELREFKDDIVTMVPQLQALLSQEKLQSLCSDLIALVNEKVAKEIGPLRKEYAFFVTRELDTSNIESCKKREILLSNLRKFTKNIRDEVQWLTQALGNIISTQTTSSRTHDLKRLVRQSTIKGNVEATKSMNFEKLAEFLEEHAESMGIMLVNINTGAYERCLKETLYMRTSSSELEKVCSLDSRTIHLDGLDAGIVLEQSQIDHDGPLVSHKGIEQPILALANLDKSLDESGSMLGWVCWDEFVNLKNPYSVRWMEKCNDQHIAALRIIMRSTISEAVSSRELNLKSSSPATGQLMGFLLMSSMMELAATRSAPPAASEPDDTTTLLMRGLFGNFLTTAGSGLKPISFCWQLFGTLPQLDIPSTPTEWNWYEVLVKLMPYTAWPMDQLKKNLVALLDKVIFRVLLRNERTNMIQQRKTSLEEYCKDRNIQLLHSRTIITILKRMLTEQDDCKVVAERLLDVIPATVKNQTESYRRLHRYIEHLAQGGQQRVDDNLIAANVFTKRSASFSTAKKALSDAASKAEKDNILRICQEILQERAAIEKCWGLKKDTVHVQNLSNIKTLLEAYSTGSEVQPRLVAGIKGDSEQIRLPWQIGKGQYGEIEELNVTFVDQILHGGSEDSAFLAHVPEAGAMTVNKRDDFEEFEAVMKPAFINSIRIAENLEDVCDILDIPISTFKAFTALLAPDAKLDRLADSFKAVMLSLLRDRNRSDSVQPTMRILKGTMLSIEEL